MAVQKLLLIDGFIAKALDLAELGSAANSYDPWWHQEAHAAKIALMDAEKTPLFAWACDMSGTMNYAEMDCHIKLEEINIS